MTRSVVALTLLMLLTIPPEAEGVALDGDVTGLLADLFEKGGYGQLPTERAAFLRVTDSGSIECLLWPRGARFQRATFRGVIPRGVIAVAHTHPNRERLPSHGDHSLANRLGLPVLVITRDGVTVARPGEPEPARLISELPLFRDEKRCTGE